MTRIFLLSWSKTKKNTQLFERAAILTCELKGK